jgi:hypothetical protein
MHYPPKILDNIFSVSDQLLLRELLDSHRYEKNWSDKRNDRIVRKFAELDGYFSEKLVPLAIELFGDQTLKPSYAVYLDYNQPTSELGMHKDNNACTYSIDYCVSANTPWGLLIEDEEFMFLPGQGLAFMGGYDSHGRGPMPAPETNRVEVITFHFCPSDHWYFTEGPDYIYLLQEQGKLGDFDSYELSPNVCGYKVE